MRRTQSLLFLLGLSLAAPGCIAITDFGRFSGGGGTDASVDGGGMDVGTTDGGPDAGPRPDAGDAGRDAAIGTDAGACTPACRTGEACCSGTCTDTTTTTNCNGCGVLCRDGTNATAVCDATLGCTLACVSGFDDCDSTPGCESNLGDVATCGDCATHCGATEVCSGGHCTSTCTGTEMNCNGACADVQTNPDHCGVCTGVCPSYPNAVRGCTAGTCTSVCVSGYSECDGDATDGCEALVGLYLDGDRDTYGTGAPVQLCPGTAGYASRNGDCDDANAARSPGTAEACNGIDDNCNGTADDGIFWSGIPVGGACSCSPGAASGSVICSGGAATCGYPAEVCNGKDDDCDSRIDNGFSCAPGATTSCTITMGTCTAIGTAVCSAACTAGTCTPPVEVCDYVDQDCDGYADEGAWGFRTPVTGFGSQFGSFHAGWRGGTPGTGAVVYMEDSGSGRTLTWRAYDATGHPTGTAALIASSTPSEVAAGRGINAPFDIGWDGAQWQVFYMYTPTTGSTEVRRMPVTAVGGLGTVSTERTGVTSVAVAEGASSLGVVIGSSSQIFGGVLVSGVWTRVPSVIAMGTNFDYPDISTVTGSRFLAGASDLTAHYIDSVMFDASSTDAVQRAATDTQNEIDLTLLWDPGTNSGIAAYRLSGTGLPFAIRYNTSTGGTLAGPLDLVTSNGPQLVFASGDIWLSRQPNVMRLRTADMTLYPESYSPYCSDLISTGSGLLCFYGDGTLGSGVSIFIACP